MDNALEQEALRLISDINSSVINASVDNAVDQNELSSLQSQVREFDQIIKSHHDNILRENKAFRDRVVSKYKQINESLTRARQSIPPIPRAA